MKAVKIVYIVMNVVMVIACIVLAVIGMTDEFNALYLILPIATIILFAFMTFTKTEVVLKKIMRVVLSAHIAVVAALTQGFFIFNVKTSSAVIIIILAILLVSFMVWSLNRMFVKLTQLAESNSKSDKEEQVK